MATNLNVCLLNDSFPPLIDGVANTVVNYASQIRKDGGQSFVVTPSNPDADDSKFEYPVYRYHSFDTTKAFGYRLGYPFAPKIAGALKKNNIDIIHCHCPAMSILLARELQQVLDAPLILTYHTKFDEDIAKLVPLSLGQDALTKAMVGAIQWCNEVWAVSRGAGENLQSLGYQGDFVVMPNGVDLPKERLPEEKYMELTAGYDIPSGVPVFLFVGRLFWYKGIKIIVDALAAVASAGIDFRMVFIGSGRDEQEIMQYVRELKLAGRVIFTGPIRDREKLRAWYCRSDLFLFPSSYDTNGLVVGEAASCSLPSVLIKGSCAAETVVNGRNGFLVEENAASMAVTIARLCDHPEKMKEVGINASNEIYVSWEQAIARAEERYQVVLDKYRSGENRKHRGIGGTFYSLQGDIMGGLANTWDTLSQMENKYNEREDD